MHRVIFIFVCLVVSVEAFAQVNGYANVTSISGSTINVSNVNETFDTFEAGEKAIIIQIQDDVIGANTGDNVNFGNLSAIQSAGLYELVTINTVVESGGIPTSITITGSLTNTYATGANSSVQLITFPVLGGGSDFTTTANITALDWDGNIGGVIAFEVQGILTLDHDIIANGAGFQGGVVINGSASGCTDNVYRIAADPTPANDLYAKKGEGIYKVDLATNPEFEEARGKILTGGGGGNDQNGGGGGNYSSGGEGGPGFKNPSGCSPGVGGFGGIALSAEISVSRIFMGGGGGAGHGDNNEATSGGDGGGIIFIRADEIKTVGTCGGRIISALGEAGGAAGQDGSGGGGASGSIVLEVSSYNVVAACP